MSRIGVKLIRILIALGAFIDVVDGMDSAAVRWITNPTNETRVIGTVGGAATGTLIASGGIAVFALTVGTGGLATLPILFFCGLGGSLTAGAGGFTGYLIGDRVGQSDRRDNRRRTTSSAYSRPQCLDPERPVVQNPSVPVSPQCSREQVYEVHFYQSATPQESLCIYVPVDSQTRMIKGPTTTTFRAFNKGKQIRFQHAPVYTGGDCPVGNLCCPQLQ